jgi:metallo-beta-lactamase class B
MGCVLRSLAFVAGAVLAFCGPSAAAEALPCPACDAWNAPQEPFRLYGNTFYVGTRGLSAVLVTSDAGHILIDGGLPESAPLIAANIRKLGFRPEQVRLIVNSHVHFDHAGGIAALQTLSGAEVAASPWSADVLRGGPGRGDPQLGMAKPLAPVQQVRVVSDGEVLRVGPVAITVHFTPGHTPGGTSWAWRPCEGTRCLNLVYADSLTAVSRDDFLFTRNSDYPNAIEDFERSFATLGALSCDIVVSSHPDFTNVFQKLARRESGDANAFVDPNGCRRYVERAREGLQRRITDEKARDAR